MECRNLQGWYFFLFDNLDPTKSRIHKYVIDLCYFFLGTKIPVAALDVINLIHKNIDASENSGVQSSSS